MSGPWLSVVGIGADGLAGLGAGARALIDAAAVLVGGRRHLAMLPADGRPRIPWRSPLEATLADILACAPERTVVLATGDPLWFGVGRLLRERLTDTAIRFEPHVSAFQLAAARLGWPLEDVITMSAHGRPLDTLRRHLMPGARLLVLTDDGRGPARIGALLAETGLPDARLWIMENLAAGDERIVATTAGEIAGRHFAALNLVALELPARAFPEPWPARTPGLADALLDHDGQLTKAEVRAVTLANLAPRDGGLLWDVGAGAGSVAIEWLRAGRGMRAVAIERRILARYGRRCRSWDGSERLVVPPDAATVAGLSQPELQALDLSGGRAQALIAAAREVATGRVDLHATAGHEHGWRRLRAIPGIGSWTIAVLALHGQQRYDQLPAGDLAYLKLVGRRLRPEEGPHARAGEDEVRAAFAPYTRAGWAGLAGLHALGVKATGGGAGVRFAACGVSGSAQTPRPGRYSFVSDVGVGGRSSSPSRTIQSP